MLSDITAGYHFHFEQSNDLGSHVYVFNGIFDFQHPVRVTRRELMLSLTKISFVRSFLVGQSKSYVVPGLSNDTEAPVTDIRAEMNCHGTACAAGVGGNILGIAKMS